MIKLLPFSLILVILFHGATHGQEEQLPLVDSLGIIDTIIVAGNTKTEAYVILNEMTLKPGSVASHQAIEFDRNRIYSLGLFTRVDIDYDTLEGQRFLFVDVSERWYLIPVPIFGFRDGDPKKPYYGIGVLHSNVAGRNQKLFVSAVLGHNPSYSLFFSDPLFDRENSLYWSASTSYSRVRNRSVIEAAKSGRFDELHFDVGGTLGKRLTLYQTLGISLGYHIVTFTDNEPGRTVSGTGRDSYVYSSLSYLYDSRDLREYAANGFFMSLYLSKPGFGEADVNFTRFGADLRKYIPLPLDLTLATRAHGTIVSGGVVPTYSRVYFGYGERIRGYFKNVFEGENMLGGTVELRYPILKARTINVSMIPLPREFSVWRFGISLALFGDTGVTWFRGERLARGDFASGYGGGIHFLLPYGIVVRTEYGFNEFRRGEFIFDVRTSI